MEKKKKISKKNIQNINIFKHLYQERENALYNLSILGSDIHPAIIKLGKQYANKIIIGSNARCVAFLNSIKYLITDFSCESKLEFIRYFQNNLKISLQYLHHCRPISISMQNSKNYITWKLTQFLTTSRSSDEIKNKIQEIIDIYIQTIKLASKTISLIIQTKISNDDLILIYGYSSLINDILIRAQISGKKFKIVIVDARPHLEGKEQMRRLVKHGIDCSYMLINAISFIMPKVNKVFLGAHGILANGAVISRIGTAQIALIANTFNVPVLVASETYKSSLRTQTDCIVHNELGNPNDLLNQQTNKFLNILNITYDLTPPEFITGVVTELGIVPCTSIPVILKIKYPFIEI